MQNTRSRAARRFAVFLLAFAPACGGGGSGPSGSCPGELSGVGTATSFLFSGSADCSFEDDGDPMVATVNSIDFPPPGMCGRYARVTGPLGSVDVRIVGHCPDCLAGSFDLNQTAFELIGSLASGTIPITWQTIPDPAIRNVSYYVDPISTEFFLSVQPRHGRYEITSLEYLGATGFVAIPRRTYNVFEVTPGAVGLTTLTGPFTVRITDVNGQSIVQSGIPLSPGTTFAGSSQFPACE